MKIDLKMALMWHFLAELEGRSVVTFRYPTLELARLWSPQSTMPATPSAALSPMV